MITATGYGSASAMTATNAANGSPARPSTQVEEQCRELQSTVDQLGEAVSHLEGRLSSVTRQEPVNQAGDAVPEPHLVPLADGLRGINSQARAIGARICYLLQALEL